MRLALALLALLGGAPDPASTEGTRILTLEAPQPGQQGWVILTGGRARAGQVTDVDSNSVTVQVDDETVIVLRRDATRGVLPRSALGDDLVPYGSLGGRQRVRVFSSDGRVREGRPVERTPGHIVVEISAGREERIDGADILVVQTLRERPRPIEPRTRYLEAPSAFLSRRGEIHLADTQAAHLSGTYGVTDWLALSAGSALPVLHATPYGANAQVSLRAGLDLHRLVRLAGGLHLSGSASGRGALYASATATVGTERGHFSLHAGPMFPGANRLGHVGELGLALAGSVALPQSLDLLAECWVSRATGGREGLLVAAVRARLGRAAVDVGAGSSMNRTAAFPWLGITWDATP